MAEVESPASPQPETSTAEGAPSPPPNCAICLGNCINKCFSDSCMHQFCFKCLLEWSKVKAVCPLCKKPFNSIIHNVKSNDEYDRHFIVSEQNNIADEEFDEHFIVRNVDGRTEHDFYIPTFPSSSRHFQFRTTFTVDPRGELAVQQLLSTLPSIIDQVYEYIPPDTILNYPRPHRRRIHRDVSSTQYRRHIYYRDLWVNAPADPVTGRYRDISPFFFRENPAARNRLVPWLNRELNALLFENTQQVMFLVDLILSHLTRHHITSRSFKQLLEEYLANDTDHFIHEFYNYMRSPYDMIGYDRHIFYTQGVPPNFSIEVPDDDSDDDNNNDSDVAVVSVEMNADPVVIEINSESSRDSDVIFREPTPPVVVDLVNSDLSGSNDSTSEATNHKPILPLKIRLKHRRQSRDKKSKKRSRNSSSSDSDSSNNSSSSSNRHYKKCKSKRKSKKSKYYIVKQPNDSDSSDNETLHSRLQKKKEEKRRRKQKKHDSRKKEKYIQVDMSNGKSASSKKPTYENFFKSETAEVENSRSYTPPPPPLIPFKILKNESGRMISSGTTTDAVENGTDGSTSQDFSIGCDNLKVEPGPSTSNLSPTSIWFSKPCQYSDSDSSE